MEFDQVTQQQKEMEERLTKLEQRYGLTKGNQEITIRLLRLELVSVVELLIQDERVDVNQSNVSGQTPLWIAFRYGRIEVVKLLLKDERVNINKVDDAEGRTIFWMACEREEFEIAKFLLDEKGVDPNEPNNEGQTPFWDACCWGHMKIFKFLLNDERVDINTVDECNRTPFFVACQYGVIKIVKYLLASKREVNVNEKDFRGDNAIAITKERLGADVEEFFDHEVEEKLQIRNQRYIDIIELLTFYEKNPELTRLRLRKQFGFEGNIFT